VLHSALDTYYSKYPPSTTEPSSSLITWHPLFKTRDHISYSSRNYNNDNNNDDMNINTCSDDNGDVQQQEQQQQEQQ